MTGYHRLWKEGYTLEDLQTSFLFFSRILHPALQLKTDTPKADPILAFQNLSPTLLYKNLTGLTIPFSYTIT